MLLLIVWANIAGLSAAVAVTIRHRLAVQAALGASRRRLLVERALQSAAIGAVGPSRDLWLADTLVDVVVTFQPHFLGRLLAIGMGPGTIVAGFAAGVIVAVIGATLPHAAVIAGRLDVLPSARGVTGDVRMSAARGALVVLQVALALVPIIGAGLLVRTVRTLADTETGFRSEGLYAVSMSMRGPRYAEADENVAFERAAVERLERLPGVAEATASVGVPVASRMRASLAIRQ